MKKLIVLISFLTLSLSSFSQTDTSKVVLPAKIARLIIKDLIEGDGCQVAMQQTHLKIQKLEEREAQKDTAITILKQKDSTNNYIISQKDEQLRLCKELSEKLQKEIRGHKTKNFLLKVGFFGSAATAAYLLILK
jgi:hypothetical protein